ncbi:Cj0814 family flagellar-dependent secreted protein [Campylobacter troglodytis]|uniref:Cj0814 family flagellar-dependent secreted protein n=1 Tax=Campylobacter troglodytis TaxID=654363 RepID=UPI001156E502|nr:hypothetical protein [Campylobacter troglodytis]TQR53016.1 hypothetical protein DMC01_12350 [Campylobacter troglodytis]
MIVNSLNTNFISYTSYTKDSTAGNIFTSNSNTSSMLVKDKSEAVNEILGYGVDNEGFFTSDFNEKAGIPKDYKIHSQYFKELNSLMTHQGLGSYSSIDIAQTIKNAYTLFSQLVKEPNLNETFSKESFADLPVAFDYDTKNLKVSKTYDLQEYTEYIKQGKIANGNLFSRLNYDENDKLKSIDSAVIFDEKDFLASYFDKNMAQRYTNFDESIDKGGALVAFISKNLSLVVGEINMLGKILGEDTTMSKAEVEALRELVGFDSGFKKFGFEGDEIRKEYDELMNSNLSLEEFKDRYLNLKKRWEAEEKIINENREVKLQAKTQTNTKQTNIEENTSKQTFTPIQATSKNDIYKDTGYFKFKDLLKNQQDLDMLSILFNSIKNDKNFSNTNNNINNTLLNLMRTNILNGVDIKA